MSLIAAAALLTLPFAQGLEVNDTTLPQWIEQIKLQPLDMAWRKIAFETDPLTLAKKAAGKSGPWILWLGDGSPLGQTDTLNVRIRRQVFSDPIVQSLMTGNGCFVGDFGKFLSKPSWVTPALESALRQSGRSGLFAVAPKGSLLGACSATNASDVAKWLQDMQIAWQQLPGARRQWSDELAAANRLAPVAKTGPQSTRNGRNGKGRSGQVTPPAAGTEPMGTGPSAEDLPATPPTMAQGGTTQAQGRQGAAPVANNTLRLRLVVRDLARKEHTFPWQELYNLDTIEIKPESFGDILGTSWFTGQVINWPVTLTRNLATDFFCDNVRGHSLLFEPSDVQVARIITKVHSTYGSTVLLRFSGNITASAKGSWSLEPGKTPNMDEMQIRNMDLQVAGRAVYDTRLKQFMQFDMVLVGTRSGGSPKNLRFGDTETQPIGFLLTRSGPNWYDQVGPYVVDRL